jgi:serine/threonine protein kinase
MMLTGLPAFYDEYDKTENFDITTSKKHKGIYMYQDNTNVPSKSAQQLIRDMLQPDPTQRPSIESIMEYDWMKCMMSGTDYTAANNNLHPATTNQNELEIAKSLLGIWNVRKSSNRSVCSRRTTSCAASTILFPTDRLEV